MNEWTEQEEQQIIERAKTGDPEANYALSLWALHRGEEEPDEPRWNRLAAKCLVKAAQAGYGPAKEQMESLLRQEAQPTSTARHAAPPAAEPEEEQPAPQPKRTAVSRQTSARQAAPARQAASARQADREDARAQRTAPRHSAARQNQFPEDDSFDADEDDWDEDDEDEAPRRGFGLRFGRGRGSRPSERSGGGWSDEQWRRMELACVFICAALLVLIAVLIITGRSGGSGSSGSGGSAIPPAGEVGSADSGADAGATVGGYPDAATQAAIMAADLDIQPAPEDYVTEPTVGTVSVSSVSLRLRKGPNTTYDPIAQMPNGTSVSVFAKKNDWDLVLYQGDDGPIYGWCSSEYVILTAGAAPAATDDPGSSVG